MKQMIKYGPYGSFKPLLLFYFSLILFLLAGCKGCQPSDDGGGNEIKQLVADADIIFNGHVSVMHSALDPSDDTGNSVVITVDTVLSLPEGTTLDAGDQLTLKPKNIGSYKEGDARTFYARIDAVGENISATETGSAEISADKKSFLQKIGDAKNKILADKLNDRISKSDLALSGKVMSISPPQVQPEGESEHDPEWMVVEIEVGDKIKGDAGKTIRILYPGSMDVAYRNYPKLNTGKEWFYILNRSDAKEAPFKIIGPESILPAERYREVKDLLKK